MTRYLLDTNIISNITKPEPSESLLAWMAEQDDENLFIASLTIGEIWRGVRQTPASRKRDELEAWFAGPEGPPALFRPLPSAGAHEAGERQRTSRDRSPAMPNLVANP